jgi:hypothetical protein
MITILVIGASHREPAPATAIATGDPSVEILFAGSAEEALEKLARNRRIDAVLLLASSPARELAQILAEEDPAAPPLFAPASMGEIAGVVGLAEGDFAALLDEVEKRLSS